MTGPLKVVCFTSFAAVAFHLVFLFLSNMTMKYLDCWESWSLSECKLRGLEGGPKFVGWITLVAGASAVLW